jgi:hypothetical protein
VRDDVEGDLLGELPGRRLVVDEDALGLVVELVDAFLAGARDRLIGRNHDPLDRREIVQGLQRHHHLRRRAVRVGDDVLAVRLRHIGVEHVGVHLGHHQRHIGVIAPEAGIIDDHRPGRPDPLAPLAGDG